MARILAALLALFAITGVELPSAAFADHRAEQCGIRPQRDYYNCRPEAVARCYRAGNLSKSFCDKRKAICERCVPALSTCAGKIGHFGVLKRSCDSCRTQYRRCTRNLPQYPAD